MARFPSCREGTPLLVSLPLRTEGSEAPPPALTWSRSSGSPPFCSSSSRHPQLPQDAATCSGVSPSAALPPYRRHRRPLGGSAPTRQNGAELPKAVTWHWGPLRSAAAAASSARLPRTPPQRSDGWGRTPLKAAGWGRPRAAGGSPPPCGGTTRGHRPYRSITRASATRQSDSPGCKAHAAAAKPGLLQRLTLPRATFDPRPDPIPPRCPLTPRARPAAPRTAAPPPRAAPRHSCRPAHAPPSFEFPARRR